MSNLQKIPVLNLSPEIESLWDQLESSFRQVLRSGQFINGPQVSAFEEEAARYLGVKHAIGVNSGTDALVIGLKSLGIGPGDEVITTPFTFFATAEAISQVGAVPVFVDIDPDTYNLDPSRIETCVTPRTKCILPVHLYGQPADMTRIRKIAASHELKVIEDTAQAWGAVGAGKKAGTWGEIGAFSFFPSKNLGAFGDGGLIATDDDELARVSRMLRVHGSEKKYFNERIGYNSRLDELQAAFLRVKLPHIDRWNEQRVEAARRYSGLFRSIPGISTPIETAGCHHVYHQYTIRVRGRPRDELKAELEKNGISTIVYYPVPMHRLPMYRDHVQSQLPEADRAAREVLSLPIWPGIDVGIQERVAKLIRAFMA